MFHQLFSKYTNLMLNTSVLLLNLLFLSNMTIYIKIVFQTKTLSVEIEEEKGKGGRNGLGDKLKHTRKL